MNDLDEFLKDTRRHLDRQLAESGATPDLAASVARAHAIDPAAVPAHAVRETAELAPIAQLRPKARRSTPVPENMSDRAALAPFTAALQGQLDADLARMIHRGAIASASGPAPAAGPAPALAFDPAPALAPWAASNVAPPAASSVAPPAASSVAPPIDLASRRRRTIVATAVALAAAVLITLGLGDAFEARPGRPGASPGAAALAAQRDDAARAIARSTPPVPGDSSTPPVPGDSPTPPVPGDSPTPPVPKDIQEIAPAPDLQHSQTEARPRPKRTPKPATPEPASAPAEDPLAALDREAQALWQQGRLRDAADKFAEIVQRAPGSRSAEAAYGDLFALENRLGGDAVSLWRAYLRQFPRGRYADDARAGVCRREPEARRGACWSDYLVAHPDGAHRREAEQVTQAAGTP